MKFAVLNERERAFHFDLPKGGAKDHEFILFDREREAGELWFYEHWDMGFQDGMILCLHDVIACTNYGIRILDIDGFRKFDYIDDPNYKGEYPIKFLIRLPKVFDLESVYQFYKIDSDKVMALSTVIYAILVKMEIIEA